MRISDWSSDVCSSDLFFVARSADIAVNTAMMRSFLATLTLAVFGSALVDNARAARTMLALTGPLLLALPVLRLACGGPTWAEMFAPAQLVVPDDPKNLGSGQRVSVRVEIGGGRNLTNKKYK